MSGPGAPHGALALDPFAYWPTARSALRGQGGPAAAPRPGYVFHTHYVAAAAGPARFTVRFEDPTSPHGSVIFRLHEMCETSNRARRIASRTISASDLDDPIEIGFVAREGGRYALLALLEDGMIAARAVHVAFETQADDSRHRARLARASRAVFKRPSIVGRSWWGGPGRLDRLGLIAHRAATIADPVSQTCTAAQFDEPAYAAWRERLRLPHNLHRKQWEFVLILQALAHHDMLRAGRRGLGFGVGAEFMPAFLASVGCEVVATDLPSDEQMADGWRASGQHLDALESLARPELCAMDVFRERVRFRPVDMTDIPADLSGFDFCWSACAYEHLGSIEAGLAFVRESVRRLKPGGIAIHTTELNLTSNRRTIDHESTVLFRRRDIERLALALIDDGHEVAPLCYDIGQRPEDIHIDMPPYRDDPVLKVALRQYVTTSFGLIVRRGP